jgi:hypothetical protein
MSLRRLRDRQVGHRDSGCDYRNVGGFARLCSTNENKISGEKTADEPT